MLFREIESKIKNHLLSDDKRILVVEGARQVGKTYIIRKIGKENFKYFVEINMALDKEGDFFFSSSKDTSDFYFKLSVRFGNLLSNRKETLIFIDEIQECPKMMTMLKFFSDDNRFSFIVSGSLLGITLKKSTSIPVGYIRVLEMYPLSFREFLSANNFSYDAMNKIKEEMLEGKTQEKEVHNYVLDLFRKYLLVGGLPSAVNEYVKSNNLFKVREILYDIVSLYKDDCTKYNTNKKLLINRIYDLISSNLEKLKKRVIIKDIENKDKAEFLDYMDEFEYLISSGIALSVNAISNPVFPLSQSLNKNLLKLYYNDVGIFSSILFKNNAEAILNDNFSINLGSLYENAVAMELKCHGHKLFYYDNKSKGEVDFLLDDYNTLSILPIEVKSGKDYTRHSAINNFINSGEYKVEHAVVFSNKREIKRNGNIIYLPIYDVMFF